MNEQQDITGLFEAAVAKWKEQYPSQTFPFNLDETRQDLKRVLELTNSPVAYAEQLIYRFRQGHIDGSSYYGWRVEGSRCLVGWLVVWTKHDIDHFLQGGEIRCSCGESDCSLGYSALESLLLPLEPGKKPESNSIAGVAVALLEEYIAGAQALFTPERELVEV